MSIEENLLFPAAKLLQSCSTLCNPIDGSPPGSLSLGFSRQEHWSGLPFPSPMHESEKWEWSRLVVSNPQRPHGLQPSRLLRPWDFPGKSSGVGCHGLLHEASIKLMQNYPIATSDDLEKFYSSGIIKWLLLEKWEVFPHQDKT